MSHQGWEHKDESHLLRQILHKLEEIAQLLTHQGKAATSVRIIQIGGSMPTNLSIAPGSTGTFLGVPNGAVQAGSLPVWTTNDPNAVPTPNLTADPTGNTVGVAVAATDTLASFVLTYTGVNSATPPATFSGSVTVTITPATPVPATAVVITQLS
jgi:hypothetical protein